MRTITVTACVLGTSAIAGAGWYGYESSARANAEAEALATVNELYEVISGPAGQERDWDSFRGMFTEDGRMSLFAPERPAAADGTGGAPARRITWTPDEYVQRAGPYVKTNGFFEEGVWNNVQVFGRMAHVLSTYETYNEPGGPVVARGINSIQLVKDPADPSAEWKVLLIVWDTESPERPVPGAMMPANSSAVVPTDD